MLLMGFYRTLHELVGNISLITLIEETSIFLMNS